MQRAVAVVGHGITTDDPALAREWHEQSGDVAR
jgi:hypothetical protein